MLSYRHSPCENTNRGCLYLFPFPYIDICTQSHCKCVHTLSSSYCFVFVSAFVYLVGLKEFTYGRDDTKHIHTYYWLPLEWSGTVCALIGWGPSGSQPKSVTLLLGWSHSMLLPVLVPRDWQQGSRAPCPAGCLRASPRLTPPYLQILLCQAPLPLGPYLTSSVCQYKPGTSNDQTPSHI